MQTFSVTAEFDKNLVGNATLAAPEGITVIGDKTKRIENDIAKWDLKGKAGEYILELNYNDEKFEKNVLITNDNKYAEPVKKTEGAIKTIQIDYNKLIVVPIGYKNWFGWLGTYILSSIIFTMALRKILKVY